MKILCQTFKGISIMISENQILQSEMRSSNINDLNQQEYDFSIKAQKLRDIGIKNIDLKDCSSEYRGDIVDAVKDMFKENSELRERLSHVRCYPNSSH